MSPLRIEILLHYWAHNDDYRNGDFSAPAVRDAIEDFAERGLILPHPTALGERPRYYRNEDALRPYVEALCALPLPVQVWALPKGEAA